MDFLCTRLAQRLHFLRRLRLFGARTEVMLIFYNAVLASIIRYGMAVWSGSLTVQCRARLQRMISTAMKIIGKHDNFQPLQAIYERAVVKGANKILSDPSHALFQEYVLLPSGRRYRASKCRSNRVKMSFIPTSILLLNKQTNTSRSGAPQTNHGLS